jgi:hypothetical protein
MSDHWSVHASVSLLFLADLPNCIALTVLACAESGKPLAEAKAEIAGGISSVEWFAEQAARYVI